MVVAMAQTEQASRDSESTGPTASSGASATAGSATASASLPANTTPLRSERFSPSLTRAVVGIVLLALSLATYTLIEGGMEPDRLRLLSLSLAGVALIVSVFEAISIISNRALPESPLELFPAAGVLLLALGGIADGYSPSPSAPALEIGRAHV